MAMIIIFQLGNLCMRNKGTLFSAHIFPTYHQTVLSETTLVTTFSTHTLSSLSSETNLVMIVQLLAIATNSR